MKKTEMHQVPSTNTASAPIISVVAEHQAGSAPQSDHRQQIP